jgi:Mg-chelatase subunit ChlD
MPEDNNLVKKNKVGLTGFAARAATQHKASPVEDGVIMANNRIALVLDNSGSMSSHDGCDKPKIELLKDAVGGFVNACDFADTALALYPIPINNNEVKLTNQGALIILSSLSLDASGGTPMGHTLNHLIQHEPVTRAVLISDGEATDDPWSAVYLFVKAEIPIDCIHIGNSRGGEETLQSIASRTGGKYLKFSDVQKLTGALKYLSPKYRALLSDPSVAKLLGADEIR